MILTLPKSYTKIDSKQSIYWFKAWGLYQGLFRFWQPEIAMAAQNSTDWTTHHEQDTTRHNQRRPSSAATNAVGPTR